MRLFALAVLALLAPWTGCGEESGGAAGSGGAGGSLAQQSAYRLSCTIDDTLLEISIDVSYELEEPYAVDRPVELTYSAAVSFGEQTSSALIDAGVSKVDIVSMRVATFIRGATPGLAESTLGSAPINDFDLEPDTDDDGEPGPHRLELEPAVVESQALQGVTEVALGLTLDQVSLVLGDFNVPADCVSPTLVGASVVFPVR